MGRGLKYWGAASASSVGCAWRSALTPTPPHRPAVLRDRPEVDGYRSVGGAVVLTTVSMLGPPRRKLNNSRQLLLSGAPADAYGGVLGTWAYAGFEKTEVVELLPADGWRPHRGLEVTVADLERGGKAERAGGWTLPKLPGVNLDKVRRGALPPTAG
eukprot:SAG11_NODE_2014_length_3922_cov_1.929898_3_plen_157_part_00